MAKRVDPEELDKIVLNRDSGASAIPDGWTSQLPLGTIDQDELDAVLLNWGDTTRTATATAAVPEPSAFSVLLIAVASLLATPRARR